jgi:GntR family transcriptional regulator
LFELDFRSRKPIYEQICDKIKELIALGDLKTGEQLPAVRALAKEIGINHNTIQKAFAQLEREGIIISITGKGSFVSGDADHRAVFRQGALDEIARVIEKNLIYHITLEDVIKTAAEVYQKSGEHQTGK